MWLGKQGRLRRESGGAELGVTSIPGTEAAVLAGGESRALPVYGPGGCCWVPEAGQRVLLIRGGPGGEEQCVAGAAQGAAPAALGPGELCLFSGKGAVILRRDGSITLRGTVKVEGDLFINGMPWVQAQGEGG